MGYDGLGVKGKAIGLSECMEHEEFGEHQEDERDSRGLLQKIPSFRSDFEGFPV